MGFLPASWVIGTRRSHKKNWTNWCKCVRHTTIGKGCHRVLHYKGSMVKTSYWYHYPNLSSVYKNINFETGLFTEIHCAMPVHLKAQGASWPRYWLCNLLKSHKRQIHKIALQKGIEFNLIPSYSSTFEEVWETTVKRIKYRWKRVFAKKSYSSATQYLLTKVETVPNLRHLIKLSSNSNDYCCLSHGQFFIGSVLIMYSENNLIDTSMGFTRE